MRRLCLAVLTASALATVARAPAQAQTASPAPAANATAAAKADPQLLARVDELWKKRDDAASLAEGKKLLDRALVEAPKDYAVLWRAASYYFWTSDDPAVSSDEKARLGKQGWELGQRAVAANPAGVEGHFFAAAALGSHSLGIGVLRALAQRIEGKFTGQLAEAERLDASYLNGAIPVTWGRYHATLPWPKYDAKKAVAQFQRALKMNPANLRARVYWAEVALEEGDASEARRLCDEVLRAQVGRYDAPEERRAQTLARALVPKVEKKLRR